MDINSCFCKRIIFKKNAIEELYNYLRFIFPAQRVLLLSTPLPMEKFGEQIINTIKKSKNNFNICTLKSTTDKNNIQKLKKIIKEIEIIVAFGSGKLCNIAKQVATETNCKLIVIPSQITSIFPFVNYYSPQEDSIIYKKSIIPQKIILDEKILLSATKQSFNELKIYVSCFAEILIENELQNFKGQALINNFELKNILTKNALLNEWSEDEKLSAIDLTIELSYLMQNISPNKIGLNNFAKMLEQQFPQKPFYELLLISAKVLSTALKKVFEQNKICLMFPNYENIAQLILSLKITPQMQKKKIFFENVLDSYQLTYKINKFKHDLFIFSNLVINNFLINKKNITDIQTDDCLNNLKILPFIFENNFAIDMLAVSGLLNFK
ncbi:MAG: iron-containing alcohol dehydrogenase [Clostridia bacterium]